MALPQENISMALFCDFENVALGVRDAKYEKFDIKKVLERLLLKGSIVVKKAYCDWDRYRTFKGTMHEANFELIEIPHVRQSGKNSADIRMVVDALDLCYTKSHVNTFVIISGDSDFSPLVSKLRENAKYVIGVGVKQSTSDLLTANCDEFIFYDDLVREDQRLAARRESRESQPSSAPRRSPEEERRRKEEMDARRAKAIEMAVETYEGMVTDRDDGGKIWASVLKEALKRRNPGFSESYYGYRTFGNLLEDAQARGLLEFGRDEKSGAYVYRHHGAVVRVPEVAPASSNATQAERSERSSERGHDQRHHERGRERGQDRSHDRGQERSRGPERDRSQERAAHGEGHATVQAPEHAAVPEVNEQRHERHEQGQDRAPSSRGRRRRRGEGDAAGHAVGHAASPLLADAVSSVRPAPISAAEPAGLVVDVPTETAHAPAGEDQGGSKPARGARKPATKKTARAPRAAAKRSAESSESSNDAVAPQATSEGALEAGGELAAKKVSRARRPRQKPAADE